MTQVISNAFNGSEAGCENEVANARDSIGFPVPEPLFWCFKSTTFLLVLWRARAAQSDAKSDCVKAMSKTMFDTKVIKMV